MGRNVELHTLECSVNGQIHEKIRSVLKKHPGQPVLVWCRDESQADFISDKLSALELEYVQYAWKT